MRMSKALKKFAQDAKATDSYWVESAKLDFSLALEKRRRFTGMSYAEIAKKLKTSAAYITKVFRGDSNLTIESMVKLARATGGKVKIQILDEQEDIRRRTSSLIYLAQQAANQAQSTGGSLTLDSRSDELEAA